MSFNPVAAENFGKRNKRRQEPSSRTGIKHSDIMRRQGVGSTIPNLGRHTTKFGFGVDLFSGDKFVVRGEVMGPGNNTGIGFNAKQDRLVLVQRGTLFVTTFSEKEKEVTRHVIQISDGRSFSCVKGMKYGLASSGTNEVELLFVEEPQYEKGWVNIEAPTQKSFEDVVLSGETPSSPPIERRVGNTIAKEQAMEMAQRRMRRPVRAPDAGGPGSFSSKKIIDANSSSVVGVNLRPSGPPSDD